MFEHNTPPQRAQICVYMHQCCSWRKVTKSKTHRNGNLSRVGNEKRTASAFSTLQKKIVQRKEWNNQKPFTASPDIHVFRLNNETTTRVPNEIDRPHRGGDGATRSCSLGSNGPGLRPTTGTPASTTGQATLLSAADVLACR